MLKRFFSSLKIRLALLFTLMAVAGWWVWAYLWNDFDFSRPETPIPCQSLTPGSKPMRFIAFGDYGQGTPFQNQLGQVMASVYRQTPYDIALLLGDNIYPDGNIQKLAKTHFEDPYKPLIDNQVRFLAAIGDHDDHRGHLEDEMAYFKMPGKFYQVSYGPVDFFVLNTTFFVRSPEQRAWIEKALAGSKARWKIVIGHHPLYSSGRNGNTEGLREILEPMLIKYHADLYLAGHDHDYERFKPVSGVSYVISGGGGSYLYDFRQVQPGSLVRLKTHHFLLFEVTDQQLLMKAINRFGDVIDCTLWEKTHKRL
ncbi:MAG: metallophosphoesterase [Vampirovibrio sp.]|jgi:3',5'-cyclic AMP phosphodiesterase CpdA|nr:metallophosphoesterase [Vampirovibrio sp.]